MATDVSRIQELINRPSESLSVELKRWINPDYPTDTEKIVRATLALRNHGGGYLIIGFDNDTLQPDKENVPGDVQSAFNIDKIQGLVSRYASEPFEVTVEFPEREGQLYPVIVVPPGVKTPVATKSDLFSEGTKLISANDVFVRSLNSNNTPSSTKAGWKDWPKVVEVCFDNREADIGRFLRRHLRGFAHEIGREIASALSGIEIKGIHETDRGLSFEEVPTAILKQPESASVPNLLQEYLQESEERYKAVIVERGVTPPDHGVWEVALLLVGDIPVHSANKQFLNLLSSNNPNYTGWPVWLDSSGFTDGSARPYVIHGKWEALIVSFGSGWSDKLDFMRLDPHGRFYLRRALEDDITSSQRVKEPMSVLDFVLPVLRTAEAIAVGLAFAKAMGYDTEHTVLAFAFRWSRLHGRELVSWADIGRHMISGRKAYQDEVLTFVNVPLETPLSALSDFVNQSVQPLFEVFDGFTLNRDVIEDLTRRLIERKL